MKKLKLLVAAAVFALTPLAANAYDSGPPILIKNDMFIGYMTKWGNNYPDINLVMKDIGCQHNNFLFTMVNRGDTPRAGTLSMRFHDADGDELPYYGRKILKVNLEGRQSKRYSIRSSCQKLKNFSVNWN